MGLSTFTELKSSIVSWSQRDDNSSQDLDDFIHMAESAMFNNPEQTLSITEESAKVTLTMDDATPSRFLALPDRFLRQRGMKIIDGDDCSRITYATPEQIYRTGDDGKPYQYTVTNQLEFNCKPDRAYQVELDYFRKFTPLSTSNATNTVLENAPNLYLFGALWALKLKEEENQEAGKYWAQFIGEIRGFNRQQAEQRYPTGQGVNIDGMIV
jgi:hypothetical protein